MTLPDGPNGERRRKSVRSTNKARAAEKLRRLRAELDKSRELPASSPTLEAWMAQ